MGSPLLHMVWCLDSLGGKMHLCHPSVHCKKKWSISPWLQGFTGMSNPNSWLHTFYAGGGGGGGGVRGVQTPPPPPLWLQVFFIFFFSLACQRGWSCTSCRSHETNNYGMLKLTELKVSKNFTECIQQSRLHILLEIPCFGPHITSIKRNRMLWKV